MNLINCFVTEIIVEPKEKYSKWCVEVEYVAEGVVGYTTLLFDTLEQAKEVNDTYKFLA